VITANPNHRTAKNDKRFERRAPVTTTTDTNALARFESDLDLVKRAQIGDPDAFASLFHAHKAKVYSVCLRMTNNTAEAEDLTQDAFLQVFRKLATFRGDSALSTWLYRIAVNTVLMHFRKKALKQVSLDEPYSKELPDGYRTIFLLHEVEGYEHQEIAELLDCSVGNSKSQLHKAKLRIRELLGRTQQENEAVASRAQRSRARREAVRWSSEELTREFPRTIFPVVSQISASNAA
jgi:RNA polymerase sigma-70 factor (ECF subfamily)